MLETPYFLWDYNLSDDAVRHMLRVGSEEEKRWLALRILEHAHFDDVFKYLSVNDILTYLPYLRAGSVMRNYWQRAFNVWGYHV